MHRPGLLGPADGDVLGALCRVPMPATMTATINTLSDPPTDGVPRCVRPWLLRRASSRCQRPSVSPLRAVIPHAGSPPPSAVAARRVTPDCGPGALPVRSPMQRSRLRLHRDAEQPGQAGCAGGMTTAARSRARGSRALFPSRVRERGPLDELTGVPLTPLRFVCCTPARSPPRSPAIPDAGPLQFLK